MTFSAGADGIIGVALELLLQNMSEHPFQGTVERERDSVKKTVRDSVKIYCKHTQKTKVKQFSCN